LEEFKGWWSATARDIAADHLSALGSRAMVESVGSSTRMEGSRMTDAEVDRFLFGPDPRLPGTQDERAVAGYAEALEMVYDAVAGGALDTDFVRRLHGIVTWYSDTAGAERHAYRRVAVRVRSYDAGGRTSGSLFEASPPGRINGLMEEAVGWASAALESGEVHPLIVTATFIARFRAIHPYSEGSGRLSRLLTTWMLVRSGCTYMPYASIERVLEERRAEHYRHLAGVGGLLGGDGSGLRGWVVFFLTTLAAQRDELMRRLERERRRGHLPELSLRLLDMARDGGRLTMAEALERTGANRNTIKVHLRQLVARGRLVRHGGGRGTWYTPA
jgi:Fic family protein